MYGLSAGLPKSVVWYVHILDMFANIIHIFYPAWYHGFLTDYYAYCGVKNDPIKSISRYSAKKVAMNLLKIKY